ncbi:trigger factor [Akkermansiaceae bacterium]|nr:trigger factor [Akkermansiaceae bacterium]MDB4429785.1 trigger factor [Akkermansiaceae bacterium]MDB4504617.1 trigger factor [Akkermansiaceae bacterium]MDB4547579.1 trigger factor [Akkermansiaceae bacterium]
MNIRVETKPNCLAALSVEVPAEAVTKERDQIVKAFSRQARIPGFRPGKAPKAVILKHHTSEIEQELESRLFQASFQEAVKQNEGLDILNVKAPQDVTHQADGSFTFNVELVLAPTFELPEYKGLAVEVPKVEVTDDNVDEQLEQLRKRFADYEDITDRSAEKGDLAIIDYTATSEGKTLEEIGGEQAKPLSSNEGYWIRIEDEAFFPGFTDALIGTKAGDEKEITVTLPDDFPLEVLREKEAVFQVKVNELKTETLPELDDDFASKIDPGKRLDEIKKIIKDDLEMRAGRQNEETKINAVIDKLADTIDFDLPEELLKSETQGQADSMVQEGQQAGMSDDDIATQQEGLFAAAEVRAKNSLKTNFLLQEIAKAEELAVESSDVLQRVTMMAKQAKQPVKKYMKELQKNGQLGNIRQNMLLSKAVDFLVEHATVTEVDAPAETPAED